MGIKILISVIFISFLYPIHQEPLLNTNHFAWFALVLKSSFSIATPRIKPHLDRQLWIVFSHPYQIIVSIILKSLWTWIIHKWIWGILVRPLLSCDVSILPKQEHLTLRFSVIFQGASLISRRSLSTTKSNQQTSHQAFPKFITKPFIELENF